MGTAVTRCTKYVETPKVPPMGGQCPTDGRILPGTGAGGGLFWPVPMPMVEFWLMPVPMPMVNDIK